ncbi:MAG: glycosyltransferase family 39 protein [bacterium]
MFAFIKEPLKRHRDILIIIFTVLLIGLPFANRAYFVDDIYQVTMAEGLLDNPLRPYDFKSDDTKQNQISWEKGSLPRMVNPPLMHYYLALVIKLFGNDVWKLRLSFLIFPILAALAVFNLGRRFSSHPLAASIIFAVTPAFWLSSYSLLIDMCMIVFVFWGFEFFMRGWERNSFGYCLVGGAALGLAPLVKYTAYSALLILFIWILLRGKECFNKKRYFLVFLLPLIFAGIWGCWNILTYGESHFLAALQRSNTGAWPPKIIVGLVFLSGVSIFSISYIIILLKEKRILIYPFLALLLVLVVFLASPFGGFKLGQSWLFSILFINSIVVFFILSKNIKSINKFLFLWFVVGFAILLLPIPWVAARYYLTILPSFVFLTIEIIKLYFPNRYVFKYIIIAIISITAVFSLMLAVGDYVQAGVYRKIADDIKKEQIVLKNSGKKIVLGDAFFGYSYYLKKDGWQVIFNQSKTASGDILLASTHSIPSVARPCWRIAVEELGRFDYRSYFPLRVMDIPSGAGFYASAGGSLPFSFAMEPIETFVLYKVK